MLQGMLHVASSQSHLECVFFVWFSFQMPRWMLQFTVVLTTPNVHPICKCGIRSKQKSVESMIIMEKPSVCYIFIQVSSEVDLINSHIIL